MARDKKPKPPETGLPAVGSAEIPGGPDPDEADYTVHVLVPLPFKERLDRIAQHVNRKRRRLGQRKRALGWFVVTNLERWLKETEAELGLDSPT